MKWLSTISCSALVLLCPLGQQSLYGQSNGTTKSAKLSAHRLVVNSDPKGAYVELIGKYTFVGRTPFTVPYELQGTYKVKAKKDGYESVSSTLNIVRVGASRITIRLSKKNRGKSASRSLILPGWGQFYGQGKFKGWFMSVGQVALSSAAIYSVFKFNDRRDEYNRALQDFDRVRLNLDQAQLALAGVQRKFNDAQDARDLRNALIAVSAGFWAYSFLDSIIFFSKHKKAKGKSIRQTPLLRSEFGKDKIMLSMNIRL